MEQQPLIIQLDTPFAPKRNMHGKRASTFTRWTR
nr:MAG TPA: hypothetical protein [Caudoviricetes sp.]